MISSNSVEDEASLLPPKRYIFGPKDLEKFHLSPARRDLLAFAAAMGRSCENGKPFDPTQPLMNLSPAMVSLYGSLETMCDWIREIPPDKDAKARFGNPSFRTWHERLVQRSSLILNAALNAHALSNSETQIDIIKAKEMGVNAALGKEAETDELPNLSDSDKTKQREICIECCEYFHACFGHHIRLDYGTGHESSFIVMLFALFKAGCFDPNPKSLRAVTLAVFSQYLNICRGIQTDYMLEPAGSHGVWGLDDYHALPFYFGACQLNNNPNGFEPNSIHDDSILESYHDKYMYFGCIRYIKRLKTGAPFRETSPMLNDISGIETWSKVSSGLLRLYEGEVLGKLPVVQHFVFGKLFQANWKPSQDPQSVPNRSFINGPGGDECIAPWARQGGSQIPGPTKAPWAS